ncbi:MAG TPA: trehalose-phosphatase [Cyclobacteriaceae bacterium]|nr:trehalose-phosphatase [Cyclobacteriaceae bacterium]
MSERVDIKSVSLDYNTANSRLILLDYDGTLVPFELHPDLTTPQPGLLRLMAALANDRKNHVVIVSGRDRRHLEKTWRSQGVVLAAEHGAFYLNPGGAWRSMFSVSGDWTKAALPALKALSFQYEGSILEVKEYSLAWHYRAIEDKVTEADRRQILAALRALPCHKHFIIYDSDCTIELRTPGIDKGAFVAKWIGIRHYDFVLAIGDGKTDEDLFKIFGDKSYTVKVGKSEHSAANFYIDRQSEVVPFLEKIVVANDEFERMRKRIGLHDFFNG